MSRLLSFLVGAALLLILTVSGSGAARADAALDLVRSIAAAPGPCQTCRPAARTPRPRAVAPRRPLTVRPPRVLQAHRPLRLTAEQRGSGRVDVLVIADRGSSETSAPSVERKVDRIAPTRPRR